jgi:hypothetical protein
MSTPPEVDGHSPSFVLQLKKQTWRCQLGDLCRRGVPPWRGEEFEDSNFAPRFRLGGHFVEVG